MDYIDRITGVVAAGKIILEDPALPEVTTIVLEINKIEKARAGTTSTGTVGVGLRNVVKPLRLYRDYRKAPWKGWALAALVLAVPFFIGRATR